MRDAESCLPGLDSKRGIAVAPCRKNFHTLFHSRTLTSPLLRFVVQAISKVASQTDLKVGDPTSEQGRIRDPALS